MILRRSNTCLKCNKYPTFNYVHNLNGLYCYDHKLNGMISVVNICIYNNCHKKASYNYKEFVNTDYKNNKLLYCKEHKLENMINIRTLKYKK